MTESSNEPAVLTDEEEVAQHTARLMAPLQWKQTVVHENAETRANLLSKAFMLFTYPVMFKAMKLDDRMQIEDLDPLVEADSAASAHSRFSEYFEASRRKNPERPSLYGSLLRSQKLLLVAFVIPLTIQSAAPFAQVILMPYVSDFIVSYYLARAGVGTEQPMWVGGLLACIYFLAQIVFTVASATTTRAIVKFENRIVSSFGTEIVRKCINISASGSKKVGGSGVMFQVFQSDVARIAAMLPAMLQLGEVFFQVVGAFIYLGFVVGWPVVGGLAIFLMTIPFNYKISDRFLGLFIQKFIAGDARTKKVVEIVNAIRIIKFYAWESSFRSLVRELRRPELKFVGDLMVQIVYLMFSMSMSTPLMQVVMFILVVVSTDRPSSVIFFQSLSLVTILSMAALRLPFGYSCYLQLIASRERILSLLVADEMQPDVEDAEGSKRRVGELIIERGEFTWGAPPPGAPSPAAAAAPSPTGGSGSPSAAAPVQLHDINFEAHPGELVVIVGKVGSGKSSLVAAMLGEMRREGGTVVRTGRVAYVPQTAWILNATVRNNIIVDRPYDEALYNRVMAAVDLAEDCKALPNGDLTEVGEKGINLSGGQRQRVSLARALYQQADIYIFDDPLSALDAHVGRHVFTEGIQGMLRDKTRILVTHQMQYCQAAQRLYVASGLALTQTAYPSRIPPTEEPGESPLVSLLRSWQSTAQSSSAAASSSPLGGAPSPTLAKEPSKVAGKGKGADKAKGELTVKEERQSGQVNGSTLTTYLGTFGGAGFWTVILTLHVLVVCAQLFGSLWMGYWAGGRYPDLQYKYGDYFFLGIYGGSIVVAAFLVLGRELVWRTGAVKAPMTLYDRMMQSVLGAPMSFYDTTPVGRIINRFTRDADTLDFQLPTATNACFSLALNQVGSLVVACVTIPQFTPIAVAFVIILLFVQPTVATVVLRRLSNESNAPLAAIFSEVLSGASSIRAVGLIPFYQQRFGLMSDRHNAAVVADRYLFEAVKVRVNVMMAFFSAAFMLLIMGLRSELKATDTLFALSQSMSLLMYMGYTMLQRGQMVLALNSIERLTEYTRLPSEPSGTADPGPEWPKVPSISFRNVSAQYRPGLPLVLEGVTLDIHAGEKIGVCGRTGSGKSSLLLTVFRLVPLMPGSQILIDGVETGSIPLSLLRSKVSAIPQEPTIFAGTVRDNLDPFKAQTDADLLRALDMCHLTEPLQRLRGEAETSLLELKVGDGDLSAGQKQLMCLARAVSRNLKILVLDEATSSVDVHTDALIQQTIRTAFKDCTVITVAHRLNTIMDSDRVLVLDQGHLAEFDTPKNLLRNPASLFASLAAHSKDE